MSIDWWLVAAAMVVVAATATARGWNEWWKEMELSAEVRRRLPPGDMGWPVIGTMWDFFRAFKYSSEPDSFINSFVTRFGKNGVYKTFMFGSPTILVTRADGCKAVLMDDAHFVTGWPRATLELIGRRSFIGITADEHRWIRRLTAAPINGFDALTLYLAFIESTVVSALENWAARGEIRFLSEMRKLTFKIIMHIFLGSVSDPTIEELESVYTDLNHGIRAMAINIPGFAYHKALKSRRKLVSVLQSVLDGRRASRKDGSSPSKSEKAKDMMDSLIGLEDENGRKLTDEEIIDTLIMYLNAGHESSGHITMWATVLLQEHPEYLHKAKAEQEEIRKNIPPGQGLTLKEVRKMEYLSKVVDETLRYINISFVTFREATTDVELNGYIIPKGWKVQLWYRSVHMDPENYKNPKEFNPSRWDGFIPKAGAFIPFGAGSRLCPGNDLAKLEITVFLHYFLLGYKITRVNPNCRVRNLPHRRPVDNCLARITKI